MNLVRSVQSSSEYDAQRFSSDLWLVTSKKHDSLPITEVSISSKPCMDSHAIVGEGHGTYVEYMQYDDCPLEENSQQKYDPRFTRMQEFRTNEHQIQYDSGVTQLLINNIAGYKATSPLSNPAKESFDIFAWTKATSEWKLECEGRGVTRQDAIRFYNIKFSSSSLIKRMIKCADTYFWFALWGAILLVPGMCCDLHYLCMFVFRIIMIIMCPIMIQWSKLVKRDFNSD